MSETIAKKPKKEDKFYPALILELIDRRPSGYTMQGNESEHLDTSSGLLLLNTSTMLDDEGNRIPIRYIHGKEEIRQQVQDKSGIKPNQAMDTICFEFGHLTVERKGLTIGLYDYLKNCEFNASNENAPEGADFTFKEINPVASSEERMELLDHTAEALTFLTGLRSKDGEKGYKYDAEKIMYLSRLFNTVPQGDSDAQRLQALIELVMARPDYFMQVIQESSSDMKVFVATAHKLGVISMDGTKASFTEDGKVFLTFKSKDFDKRIEELVAYFDSAKGEEDVIILRARVEGAKVKENEVAE